MTYSGPSVFRAPYGNDAALENFERTVLEGVAADRVAEYTDRSFESDVVRLWGTKETVESTWDNVSSGDFLFFYRDGFYEYAVEVTGTEWNEELGKAIWPNYEDGNPWTCIIYLDEPVELGVDSSEIHDLAGYDIDYPMGFSPLNEMGVGGIRGRYGSVEGLVYGDDGRESSVDVRRNPSVSLPVDTLNGLHYPPEYGPGKNELVGKIADALNAGKHIIFTGPPGTGKTEIARRVANHLATDHADVFTGVNTTTATADWSTFETVGGYMPNEDGEGTLGFKPGQVLRCFKRRSRQRNDLLIIDEVNRSDIDKSFGQLFTLLSGQPVQLPFTREGKEIDIRPAEMHDDSGLAPNEYVVPTSWRILATMNSYDKTSLYEMSYAFMRRFAFIYIDAPEVPSDRDEQERLVASYAEEWGVDESSDLYRDLGAVWNELNTDGENRKIGPAIVEDMLRHVAGSTSDRRDSLTEAVVSYVFPQLEGVRQRDQIVSRLASLDELDGDRLESVASDILQV